MRNAMNLATGRLLAAPVMLLALVGSGRAEDAKTPRALVQDQVIVGGAADYTEVRHVVLRGSNEEIGRALAFLAHKHHGLSSAPSRDPLRTRVQRHYLEKNAPILIERMRGVAAFFGKRLDDDSLDFTGLWYVPFRFGCSVVYYPPSMTANGAGVVSRNLDFGTGTLRGARPTGHELAALARPYVVEIYPDKGFSSLALTCCDLLSGTLDGINSEGLAVTCLADDELHSRFPMEPTDAPVGLGSLQVLRHLLDTCATVQEAKETLLANKQYYEFLSLHYLIADRHGNAFVWEYSQAHNREYIIENPGKALVTTNFSMHRHLHDNTPPSVEAARKICPRYCVLCDAIRARSSGWTVEEIKQNHLAADPSKLPQSPGRPPVRALWHALYFPSERRMQVCFYLGDRPDPEHPGKTRIVRSNYLEFALSDPDTTARTQPPAASSDNEFRAILKAFAKKQQEIFQSFQRAKTEADKRRAWDEYRKGGSDFAPQVLRLAEKDPHQPFVPEALGWIVTNAPDAPEADKALALLIRDPANSRRIASACDALAGLLPSGGERLLRTALEQSKDREVRGRASFALGVYFMRRAEPAGEDGAEEIEANNRKALSFFDSVIAQYGDLKHWQGTLRQAALKNIKEIRERSIGKSIPEVQGMNVDGQKIKLSDYHDKVVLLDFWGTWCPPCMLMVPHERSLLSRLEGRPFAIVGVNADKDRDLYRKVCRKMGITWPSFFEGDVGGPIAGQFNLYNYPTVYLIDHRGVIRRKYREPPDEGALDRAVDRLVSEAESAKK